MSDSQTSTLTNEHAHVHRDDYGAKLGMWLFLFTELVLFGGLFILYMSYRFAYPDEFHLAAKELNITIGAINTIVLLTSSLTMVLAVSAMQRNRVKLVMLYLAATIGFSMVFMVNKVFEWAAKYSHGIWPGAEELLDLSQGEIIFYALYFTMTGLHGLHVIIGAVILSFLFVMVRNGSITHDSYVKLENGGLYWHLVDLIWIFLFPLFYLLH